MKKILAEFKNFKVCEDEFRYNNEGERRDIQYVEQFPVVIAVTEDQDGSLIFVEHWRPILNVSLLECPGGKVDEPGETIQEALARELREEIGFHPGSLRKLCSIFTSVGTSTEEIHCFVATDLQPSERDSRDVKRMNIRHVYPQEVRAMLEAGEFHDAKTSVALFHYLRQLAINTDS